jgi:5,10-methylenetetrahydromethanopterin reductase
MKIGINLIPNTRIERITNISKCLDEYGIDYIMLSEYYKNRNIWVALTSIALNTKKAKIGPAITSPYTTHPVVIAQFLASLNEVSKNRAFCTLASGDKHALAILGVRQYKPIKVISQSIKIINGLLSDSKVISNGYFKVNAKLNFKPKKVPIFVGAQGERMLRLSASLADGVMINAADTLFIKDAVGVVKDELRKINKKKFEIGVISLFSVSKSEEKARKEIKPFISRIVAGSNDKVLERHKIDKEKVKMISYELLRDNREEAAKIVDDKMIDSFSIAGSLESCLKRIKELKVVGVDTFIPCIPIEEVSKDTIEILKRELIKRVKEID